MQSLSISPSKIPISPSCSHNLKSKAELKKKLSEEKPFGKLWPFPNVLIPPGAPLIHGKTGKAGFEAVQDVGDAPW